MMKQFFYLLAADLRRAILSIRFLLSACGVALVLFIASWGQIKFARDVLYLLGLGISGTASMLIIAGILPLFPFATTFATEWQERAVRFWIVRTGIRNYSMSKVLVSAISGFLTTAVGMLMFVLALRTRLPLFVESFTRDPYEPLLLAGKPVQYLCYYITHYSLSAVLFAVAAVWVSTFIPNKFTAVAAPLVLYFVAHRATTGRSIPQYLRIVVLVEGMYPTGSPHTSLLLKLGIVLILCLLMGYGTVRQIRRRIQND